MVHSEPPPPLTINEIEAAARAIEGRIEIPRSCSLKPCLKSPERSCG